MDSRNRIFDDAARVAGGALGTLAGVRREIDALVRHQLDRLLSGMDLVTRDEFDAVKEMAAKARSEQDRLEKRLAVLEAQLADQATPKASARPKAARSAKRSPKKAG